MKNIAAQLIEIAQIESHIPLFGARIMIAGQGKTAEELAQLLAVSGAFAMNISTVEENEIFDIVFLLEEVKNESLQPHLAQKALIIDNSPQKRGEWAFFDGKGGSRRIRVVSILEKDI